ncbi:MAG TPA: HypC/HybG/HupF family hydrogenase formation chaperone [Terriglobales bacterium]|nr:HypC/HybG/HupF family hydrogenase formation chaperone [Terriglobales bacterium]
MCLAVPGRILQTSVSNGVRAGRVEFGGIVRQVCLELVPEAEAGDYVLVHVGFAISRVDRQEAERTRRIMDSMGWTEELAREGVSGSMDGAMPGTKAGDEK